jgi:phage-related protein
MPPRYGRLEVPVVAAGLDRFERDVRGAAQSAGTDAAASISSAMTVGLRGLGNVTRSIGRAAATGLGVATTAAAAFGVASFRTAARVGEMDATLRALAQANRLSYPQMQRTVREIRDAGIEAGVAQNTVAQFARNQLDLAKSTDLARLAQNAAVISGRNSTEVLDQLIHGITTQNSLVLRNAGVNVQAGQAIDKYAKSVGKSVRDLTDAERAQAVLNAVLEAGGPIAGAYAAAMEEPGKVLRSFPRVIDNVRLAVGRGLVDAFKQAILNSYHFADAFAKAVDEGGKLAPVVTAIGQAVAQLAKPLETGTKRAKEWLDALKPETVERIAKAIKTFGPAAAVAAGGLSLMVAPSILRGIPGIGALVGNLSGPFQTAGKEALKFGKTLVSNAMAAKGLSGPLGALKASFGLLTSPIGLVVAGFAVLMAVSPEFRAAVMDIVVALGRALMPVVRSLVDVVRLLAEPFVQIARILGGSLAVALRAVLPMINALAWTLELMRPVLGPLTVAVIAGAAAWKLYQGALAVVNLINWIRQFGLLAVQVNLLAVKQAVAAVAAKAWAAAQWLLNAAMTANPIGLVVVAIAALVAGMVIAYQRSQTFRNIVNAAFSAVAAVFMTVVRAAQTLWRWITGGSPGLIPALLLLGSIASAMASVVRVVLTTAFNACSAAASFLWRSLTAGASGVLQFLRTNWPTILAILTGPIGLAVLAITRHWSTIRSTTASAVSAVQSIVSAGFNNVRTTTSNLMSATSAAIAARWADVRRNTSSLIGWMTPFLFNAWSVIWNQARAGWTGIANVISTSFSAIREGVAAPVRWVVGSVINPLIRGINALITKIGIGEIPQIAGFAGGGQVPGRDRGDRHLILAEAGEWVLTRAQARAIGYRNLANLPRFAGGGEVGHYEHPSARIGLPSLKDIGGAFARITHLDHLAGLGRDLLSPLSGFLSWMAVQAFEALATPLKKLVEPWASHRKLFPERWIGKLIPDVIGKAIEFITSKGEPVYEGGGAGVDALAAEVMQRFPGLRITSALRPGDPGYHGRNLARDLGGPVAVMNAAGAWMARTMVRALLEGIHNPTLSVKNGALVPSSFWGPGTWAGHADHIHMAAAEGTGAPSGTFTPAGSGVARWRPLVTQIAGMFGIGHTVDAWMRQIQSESGGNANIIQQIRDVNWPNNLARGLLQVIPTTFAAQRGNPFGSNIMDPRANIWAAMSYAVKRYGARLLSVIGRGHGYARGGVMGEPGIGIGLRTGLPFSIAERGPELITPIAGTADLGAGRAGRSTTINVYPQPQQSPVEIAAAVSRELAWAEAGGV